MSNKKWDNLLNGNESAKWQGFDNNPENINRNGRPKKSFASINEELKKKGYEPLTKSQLIEWYSLVFNTDEEELDVIAENPETPFALKIIIKEMKNESYRWRALQDYRDYMFGKAKETKEVKVTETFINEADLTD